MLIVPPAARRMHALLIGRPIYVDLLDNNPLTVDKANKGLFRAINMGVNRVIDSFHILSDKYDGTRANKQITYFF